MKKYACAFHAGGLDDCMKTEIKISDYMFWKLLPKYKFYAYDEKIKADRYILKDIEKNYDSPIWLHDYTCQVKNKKF